MSIMMINLTLLIKEFLINHLICDLYFRIFDKSFYLISIVNLKM